MTGWSGARDQAFRDGVADRGDGRVRRLQERRDRSAARGGHGHGPVPRRRPRRARSSTCAANASSRTPSVTAAVAATRSTECAAPCAPGSGCSPTASAARIEAVFAAETHVAVEVTWWAYQQLIAAYAAPRPAAREDPAGQP